MYTKSGSEMPVIKKWVGNYKITATIQNNIGPTQPIITRRLGVAQNTDTYQSSGYYNMYMTENKYM